MRDVLERKFNHSAAARNTLLNTGEQVLVEDTNHMQWARGRGGKGENWLGLELMHLRDRIRKTNKEPTGVIEGDIRRRETILIIGDSILNKKPLLGKKIKGGFSQAIGLWTAMSMWSPTP